MGGAQGVTKPPTVQGRRVPVSPGGSGTVAFTGFPKNGGIFCS